MSVFILKLIAMITMFIDHSGAILFPEESVLRLIGRLSFPIFAFLIANGIRHTHNEMKYLIRLGIFAVITEPIFDFAFTGRFLSMSHQNILFTFFIAVLGVVIYKRMKEHSNESMSYFSFVPIIFSALIGERIGADYGVYGVITVYIFYFLYEQKAIMSFVFVGINLLFALPYVMNGGFYSQALCVFSLPFILLYNNKLGPKLKYLFYVFYPGHLLILALIKQML